MKVIAVIAAAVATVSAQALPSGFPQCGADCVGNMLGLASSLGCPDATAQCLCNNINFSYGIRDCSVQHCQDMNLANTVIAYGSAYCSSAGVIISMPPATGTLTIVTPSATVTATAVAITTAPIVTTITSGGSTFETTVGLTTIFAGGAAGGAAGGSGGAGAGIPIAVTTSPIVGTVTSGGSTFETTLGFTTIFTSGGAAGAGGAGVGTSVVPVVTTITSGGSTFTSTIGSSTVVASVVVSSAAVTTIPILSTAVVNGSTTVQTIGSSTVTAAVRTATTTSTSAGLAAHKTAAPAAGLLAAAGLAVLLM